MARPADVGTRPPVAWTTTDLDERPELLSSTLPLFAAPPGHNHLVCGLPQRMGQMVTIADFRACLGVLLLVERIRPIGALALCPYSDTQVTLWGPAILARERSEVARALLSVAREALRHGGFSSMRLLVDSRNRIARGDAHQLGFAAWKDMYFFEAELHPGAHDVPSGLRVAAADDHAALADILNEGFPDSEHCRPNLIQREDSGYRHYILRHDGHAVGAGAVQHDGRRAWLKLIAVASHARGAGHGLTLLRGILASEQRLGSLSLSLEVLADNAPAIAMYHRAGLTPRWTATIFTGPV